MPKKKNAPSLEESLQALEEIVQALESDELPLDEALAAFEKGIGMAREAQNTLAAAEQRVFKLSEENGDIAIEALDDGEENE